MGSTVELIKAFKAIIPPLTNELHKGSMGRIGVFGGSVEFTGAPYFAGIASLRTGADLTYVFSASSAAPVIKSYSPELMVMPFLDSEGAVGLISPWLNRLHTVLIGPGLGRKSSTFSTITQVVNSLKTNRIEQTHFKPIIFDADGLYYVMKNVDLVSSYPGDIYLTPNAVEFEGLVNCLCGDCNGSIEEKMEIIREKLGDRVTVLLKGKIDLVYHKGILAKCDLEGSPRRCGGQGDLLSGALATFATWVSERKLSSPNYLDSQPDNNLAGVAAFALTKTCNRLAYGIKKRSTLVTDMIDQIPSAFQELFGEDNKPN